MNQAKQLVYLLLLSAAVGALLAIIGVALGSLT